MEFVFNRVKSYFNRISKQSLKETSVSVVILLSGITLIAGAAYAAESDTVKPAVTMPAVTQAPYESPDKGVLMVTTTTTPPVPELTLEQWGALSVHTMNTDPQAWHVFAYEQRNKYGKCGEWHDLAIAAGWPESEWPILSKVMFRESRCNWNSHNKTDPSSGSRGLMQINGYWCRKSQWTQNGWLQDHDILNTCDDLFNPATNLKAGLAMWLYGEEKHGCGWRGPWATPCN